MATKREIDLYGDLVHQYRPTIKSLIVMFLMNKIAKKNRYRENVSNGDIVLPEESNTYNQDQTPASEGANHFALILDDAVEEIIVVNPFIASLLSNESLVIAPFDPIDQQVTYGTKFIDGNFIIEDGNSNEEN